MAILHHSYKRTTLLTVLMAAMVLGVALAPHYRAFQFGTLLVTGVMVLAVARTKSLLALGLIAVVGIGLGLWRGNVYVAKRMEYEALYGKQLSLIVHASTDASYNDYQQLGFDATAVNTTSGQRLAGKIQVTGFGENAIFQGDELLLEGKLKPTLGAAQARMPYAQVTLIAHHPSYVGTFRRKFAAGVQTALPEPLNSFVLGLLTGQRSTLPASIKETLLMVGLTHIIAVSGYNMTIMLRASKRLLGSWSKRLSLGLSFCLIVLFLLITGMSASIVRAAIVSGLSLIAAYYGRAFRPLLLIVFAAAITAMVNPFFIWTDAGWYLSFLAFVGVMIISPLLSERLPPRLETSTVVAIALESICAEISTLPYLLHTFGQMTVIGLVANVLIVAFIPFAMLAGLLAGLAGMFISALSGWFSWPAVILLTYMLDTAGLLSRIPDIFHKDVYLSAGAMWQIYAIITAWVVFMSFKASQKAGTITDKNYSQLSPSSPLSSATRAERIRIL
jgi:ComEC/Rec2-related protein